MLLKKILWTEALAVMLAAGLVACSDDDDGPVPPSGLANSYAVTSGNKLINFSRSTPGSTRSTTAITGLDPGETLLGVDFRPADATSLELLTGPRLYALTSAGRIVTIDIGSGVATLKSTLFQDPTDTTAPFTTLTGIAFGVDFNPVPDRLRVVSDSGQNLRINVDTGATTTDGAVNPAPTKAIGAVAYTQNFAAACRTVLYTIDSASDTLFRQDPPNDGTQIAIGALGVDVAAVAGFDIYNGVDVFDGVAEDVVGDAAVAALTTAAGTSLYAINLTTGAATSLGALALPSGETLAGLAFPIPTVSPSVQAAGELLGLTVGNKLVSFNRGSPAKLCTSTAVTGLGGSEKLLGIDVRPATGELYGLSDGGRVFTINRATGAAALKSTLSPADSTLDPTPDFGGLVGTSFGIDFNPVPDRLRVVSDTGQNLRINVDNGATITDTGLTALGVTAAAYTNSIGGGGSATLGTTLYYLDSSANALLTTAAPNDGITTPVGGGLGVDIDAVNGFEIDGRTNAAFFVTGSASSTLYSVNLTTGVATAVTGAVGGGEALTGLTFNAGVMATAYGVTMSGNLVSFAPTAPVLPATTVTILASLPVSGLGAGESLLGLDYRPATGKLYGLASSGKLYTIDDMTGVATLASTLVAVAGDDSPYTALTGPEFGIDFNPVPDRLRVVSDGEQNLRINVDSGMATTDTNLISAGDVFGAAYINNFVAPPSTALYGVDAAADALVLIGANPATGGACPGDVGNPNCGLVTPVGALGVDVSTIGDIDITGGGNGFVLGALQPAAGGVSGLYRINLLTGSAGIKIADIATADSSPVRGFAVRVK